MFKKIKQLTVALSLVFAMAAPLAIPVAVSAATPNAITDGVCSGAASAANGAVTETTTGTCTTEGNSNSLNDIVKAIINIFSLIVGFISVIMIIIGGFKYITSNGDSGNVTGAKNTIMYALIGLVIVALAQVIVYFVLGKIIT